MHLNPEEKEDFPHRHKDKDALVTCPQFSPSPVSWPPFFLRTVGKIYVPSQFCPFSSDTLKGLELPRQVLSNINGDFSNSDFVIKCSLHCQKSPKCVAHTARYSLQHLVRLCVMHVASFSCEMVDVLKDPRPPMMGESMFCEKNGTVGAG